MKRKVIQLAGKTLVVSLPSKWAKKYNVRKGNEVEVSEQEKKLVIQTQSKQARVTKVLDAKDLKTMLCRTIGALYKAGYDEIEITYHSPSQYSTIRDVLNKTCMGYEIIRHGQRTLLIRDISLLQPQEFDNILRRLFLTLLSSADDALEYIKQGNLKGMEEVSLRDPIINKYSDLCRRILNMQGCGSMVKTNSYYYICEQLERIGDAYRDFMVFLVYNKIKKMDNATIALVAKINQYLRKFYELFYKFDFKKLETFGEEGIAFDNEFKKQLKTSSLRDFKLFHGLYRICSLIFEMNGALILAGL
jgi:phosphate uptake regulator